VGPKVFEQAAGFLRVPDSENPLDNSAVHPERYELVERIAKDLGVEIASLVGNEELARGIDLARYESGEVGRPTLEDIASELARPRRDPRKEFAPPSFRDDVRKIEDLARGMEIEGVVTNVTDFGAFVDVGVHQDGLVHISELADRFVSDPREVVRVGQRIKVRVLEVDLERTRISLTARSPGARQPRPGPRPEGSDRREKPARGRPREQKAKEAPRHVFANTPFADLLQKLGK
jgi:uncharacterized protein